MRAREVMAAVAGLLMLTGCGGGAAEDARQQDAVAVCEGRIQGALGGDNWAFTDMDANGGDTTPDGVHLYTVTGKVDGQAVLCDPVGVSEDGKWDHQDFVAEVAGQVVAGV